MKSKEDTNPNIIKVTQCKQDNRGSRCTAAGLDRWGAYVEGWLGTGMGAWAITLRVRWLQCNHPGAVVEDVPASSDFESPL